MNKYRIFKYLLFIVICYIHVRTLTAQTPVTDRENNVTTIVLPGGASFHSGVDPTSGAIKIKLPVYYSSTMLKIRVEVFNYRTDESFTALISGYNFGAGDWRNCSVQLLTNEPTRKHTFYFGDDGTNTIIWIGESSTTWAHLKVRVVEVQAGNNGADIADWDDGWNISLDQTDFSSMVNETVTNVLPVAQVGDYTNLDRNGLKSTVTNALTTNGTQAKRFEVATISYNAGNWQYGGITMIELYNIYYGTGYAKYLIEAGYFQGTHSTSPKLTLVDTRGKFHNAQVILGTPYDTGTSRGGFPNMAIPVYVDIRYYSRYQAKISHQRNRVEQFTNDVQIIINESPTSVNIPDFTTPSFTQNDILNTGNLKLQISTDSDQYITGAPLGIGTTNPNPDAALTVGGLVRAREVKVSVDAGADFVFEPSYTPMPIDSLAAFIGVHQHLPDIPSANTMIDEGLDLGTFQIKLLQKIEELTLYTIEQDKRLVELEQKIAKLMKNSDDKMKKE